VPADLGLAEQASVAAASVAAPLAVQARNLGVVFDSDSQRTVALEDVSLDIARGSFVSLIGPSGCGKTTLLRAIADLERVTSGSLVVNGATPERGRLDRAYGYVFQAPALYPWRSVERNVTLPLEIMGLPAAERRARAERYLDVVGLREFRRRFPWQLSGGMQQRVSIARALSFEPQLLLMDEPFGALDEITRDGLNQHLRALWRQSGMTVVFVTHSIPEAVYLSSHVVVMSPRPGKVVELVDVDLPDARELDIRETPAFLRVAHRVRAALRAGHSYD
jgi:NitT/TauT family transport system ATP-binding protein